MNNNKEKERFVLINYFNLPVLPKNRTLSYKNSNLSYLDNLQSTILQKEYPTYELKTLISKYITTFLICVGNRSIIGCNKNTARKHKKILTMLGILNKVRSSERISLAEHKQG